MIEHSWNVTPEEAIKIQLKLKSLVIKEGKPENIKLVAGADISTTKHSNKGYAAVVVLEFPEMKPVEKAYVEKEINFPYIPGLLSFRETPLILEAYKKLKNKPDLLMLDGQGIAHPRRFGIASHVGVILDIPTIGVAKTKLVGNYEEPSEKAGSFTYLTDNEEIIGAVVRTKSGVKPVFVSIGHRISLEEAIKITLACTKGYRIPEPTRLAHIEVNKVRTKQQLNLPLDE